MKEHYISANEKAGTIRTNYRVLNLESRLDQMEREPL